VLCTLMKVHTI